MMEGMGNDFLGRLDQPKTSAKMTTGVSELLCLVPWSLLVGSVGRKVGL